MSDKHDFDYDLFVIGAGSGGVRAARIAAGYGARVAIAEEYRYGGTCVIRGCVPKKLLVYASRFPEEFEDAAGFGWALEPAQFDWQKLIEAKDKEIQRLEGIYESGLKNAEVTRFESRAVLEDAHTIKLTGLDKTVTADKILIATGGKPFIDPALPGKELCISSNEIFHLQRLPEKMVVVGGGYIAVEFAGIFAGLGVDTTLLYRGPLFLRGFDISIREFVKKEISNKNINLLFNTNVNSIKNEGASRILSLSDGEQISCDLVLYATGRKPNTTGLGLENTEVELGDREEVLVNKNYQTSQENIYAIGDVTDRVQLTPVAIEEGMYIANQLFGDSSYPVLSYENIPTAVFCQPNIGTVGLTEDEALAKYSGDLDIYESQFKPMKHTLTSREERSFMKMIVRRSTDAVLGIHMVGSDAGELVQGLAVAMVAGATKHQFDQTIGIHPTAAEEFVTLRQVSRSV